jgi:hypothetical protein
MNARVCATTKALEERGIFECFAQAAGLVVRPGSISQPDPPDILCELEELGPVGFELVQLDDQGELQRMKYLRRGPEFWEESLREIPQDVVERHRAAQINVVFDAKAKGRLRMGGCDPTPAGSGSNPRERGGLMVYRGCGVPYKSAELQVGDKA